MRDYHHPERSGARGLKTPLLFTISHFYIMYYTIFYLVNEIGRLLKYQLCGAKETILNGCEIMKEDFCSMEVFANTYTLKVSDAGCWID